MADNVLLPVVLSELIDSDDEKLRRGEIRDWLKRREKFGIYHTLILELMVEDPCSFKQMFHMSVMDLEIVLQHISDLITYYFSE